MDQLAQLKDIHLPEQVHQWPIAFGWWLLLTVIIIALVISVNKFIKQRKLTSVKRQAIKQLTDNDKLSTEQCVSILKWACMHYYSRQDIAAKHGTELNEFLTSKLEPQHQADFTDKVSEGFSQYYRKSSIDIYAEDFHQAALYWFKHAHLINPLPIAKGEQS